MRTSYFREKQKHKMQDILICNGCLTFKLNDKKFDLMFEEGDCYNIFYKGEKVPVSGFLDGNELHLSLFGENITLFLAKSRLSKGDVGNENSTLSPMPGKIIKVFIEEGQSVKKGDSLIILEAMKMEHTIKASFDGVIDKVFYKNGELVDGGVELVSLDKRELNE